ncbi:MAG: RodZ domain-containing protein [Pseudomonadota bacterium]
MNSERAEPPQSQASREAPGAQLKVQREAMGWTIEQVADQLKLAPRQVVALEAGDFASLPTMAVVRGFIRAYAKVVKLDAAPLVAMIEVQPIGADSGAPVRREVAASFSETRFPSMTKRSGKPVGLIVVVLVALVAAAAGAYRMGYIPSGWLTRSERAGVPAPSGDKSGALGLPGAESLAAKPEHSVMTLPAPLETAPATPGQAGGQAGFLPSPVETAPARPGQSTPPASNDGAPGAPGKPGAPLQSPSVPLISVPPPAAGAGQSAAPAAPAVSANPLVLTVRQDSWVEIRRHRGAPLIARIVKAGSVETFSIDEPVLLVVGKPGAVDATLRGTALPLAEMAPGKPARMNIN